MLVNLNRVLIFTLTLTGLLMDGLQSADLPCTLALLVWLWLPLCTRLEANLLGRARRRQPDADATQTASHRQPRGVGTANV